MKKWLQKESVIIGGIVLLGLVILAALMRGIWAQVEQLQRIQAAEDELLPILSYEEERQGDLTEELERVSAPDYPEEWARIHANMVRPGEVPVDVSLPEAESDPTPTSTSTPTPSPDQ